MWAALRVSAAVAALAAVTSALECVVSSQNTSALVATYPQVAACVLSCGQSPKCRYDKLIAAPTMEKALKAMKWSDFQRPIVTKRVEAAAAAARRQRRGGVVFFGDSLFATAAARDEFLLCAEEDRPCANAGSSMDTWRMAFGRAWQACGSRAETVHVLLGLNDLLQGAPTERVAKDAEALLRYLRGCLPKARIFLLALPPHNPHRSHAFDEIALNAESSRPRRDRERGSGGGG